MVLACVLSLFLNSSAFNPVSYARKFGNFCLNHYKLSKEISQSDYDFALFDRKLFGANVVISVADKNSNRVFDKSDILSVRYERDGKGIRMDFDYTSPVFFGKYKVDGHVFTEAVDLDGDVPKDLNPDVRYLCGKVGWFLLPYRTIKSQHFPDTSGLEVMVNKDVNKAIIEQVGRKCLMPGHYSDPDYNYRLIFQVRKKFKEKQDYSIDSFDGVLRLDVSNDILSDLNIIGE